MAGKEDCVTKVWIFSKNPDIFTISKIMVHYLWTDIWSSGCSEGWYGPGCNRSCDCSNRGSCYHVTGQCACSAGWVGPICNKCECFGTTKQVWVFSETISNFLLFFKANIARFPMQCYARPFCILVPLLFFSAVNDIGKQGWRSGESTRLPPTWPGLDSELGPYVG